MKTTFHIVLLCLLVACTSQFKSDVPLLISRIQEGLPDGWECVVEKTSGQKGHPHGLKEPVFRVDFTNPNATIPGRPNNMNPSIQLYFYPIESKPHVMTVIDKERMYSWDIPIYFGETEEHIVVTSPAYVNHGVFTEEAKKTIRPMWNVLRKYIECKEDQLVEQLAQPDK